MKLWSRVKKLWWEKVKKDGNVRFVYRPNKYAFDHSNMISELNNKGINKYDLDNTTKPRLKDWPELGIWVPIKFIWPNTSRQQAKLNETATKYPIEHKVIRQAVYRTKLREHIKSAYDEVNPPPTLN